MPLGKRGRHDFVTKTRASPNRSDPALAATRTTTRTALRRAAETCDERDALIARFVARTTATSHVDHYLEDLAVIEQIAALLR